MSDVIEFPTNADQYYRKALSALKVHDFGRAQELLIKSYETDPQVHVFEELIKLYIARGQKADLLNCWQTYFPDIEAVNDWNVLLLYGASLSLLYDLDAALLRLYQLQARFQAAGWDSEDLLPFIHQLNHEMRIELFAVVLNHLKSSYIRWLVTVILESGYCQVMDLAKPVIGYFTWIVLIE